MKREVTLMAVAALILLTVPLSDHSDWYIMTAKGCNVTYETLEPILVFFKTEPGVPYQICVVRPGYLQKCPYSGTGDGSVGSVSIIVGEPPGEAAFVLRMACEEESGAVYDLNATEPDIYTVGDCMYTVGECIVYLQESVIEEDPLQEVHNPCEDVNCPITVCRGYDLWTQLCVDGECVDYLLAEANSVECGYDLCTGIECDSACEGFDLWSQTCVDGECVPYYLIEANSLQCGFDPCTNHCDNGRQDCGEYGVDCGAGCPFIDTDHDNVEDCIDWCLNSRCDKVDANGCETDSDGDGVPDCDDECQYEAGDASDQGCPSNDLFLFMGLGGIFVLGGVLGLWAMGNRDNPPADPCEDLRRQLEETREAEKRAQDNYDQKSENRQNAEEKIEKFQNDLEEAEKEIKKAEREVDQANKPLDESSSIEIAGEPETQITTHDLRLREQAGQQAWGDYQADLNLRGQAGQQAWEDYQAGRITVQECMEIWGESGETAALECMEKWEELRTQEALERLREDDRARRAERLQEAQDRLEEAENEKENLQEKLDRAEEDLQQAREEEEAAKSELEDAKARERELQEAYEECEEQMEAQKQAERERIEREEAIEEEREKPVIEEEAPVPTEAPSSPPPRNECAESFEKWIKENLGEVDDKKLAEILKDSVDFAGGFADDFLSKLAKTGKTGPSAAYAASRLTINVFVAVLYTWAERKLTDAAEIIGNKTVLRWLAGELYADVNLPRCDVIETESTSYFYFIVGRGKNKRFFFFRINTAGKLECLGGGTLDEIVHGGW